MKKLMNRAFTLGMALMFLVIIVPAAFAEADTDATDTNIRTVDASSGRISFERVAPRERVGVNNPITVNPIRIRPISMTPRVIDGPIEANPRTRVLRKMGDDVEKSERRSKIKNSINHYREKIKYLMSDKFLEEENYNGEKAAKFLVFSTLLTERAIDFLENAEKRAENSPKFLENHPDALENIGEKKEDLLELYGGLYEFVSDSGMSEMGLVSVTSEDYQELKETYLISLGKELKSISKNKYLIAYKKYNKEKVVKKLRSAAKNWKKKYGADKVKDVEVEINRYETSGNIGAVKTEITKMIATNVESLEVDVTDVNSQALNN